MKHLIQKLWVSIAMLCLSFSASAYDFEVDGICYDVIDPAELTCGISGTTESLDCTKDIVLPSQVSFLGKTLTVIKIMDSAFKETNIVNISLPKTCTSIGKWAFKNCEKLQSINLPEGVKDIGREAFRECRLLTNVTIPNGVTNISVGLFRYCSSLTNIVIPNGVTEIGAVAFDGCRSLTKIVIPKGVLSIGGGAFSECYALTSFYISEANNDLSLGNVVFQNSKIKTLFIGRGLSKNNVGGIIEVVFCNTDIDSLIIGSKVAKIELKIFTGGSSDDKYSVKSVQKLNILPSEEILECDNESLLRVNPSVLIIGRQLKGDKIFKASTNVRHLEIGENVNDISNLSLGNNNITTMLVKTAIPPKCITETFSKNTYLYCSLKVPVGTLDAYKSADGWKNFWNIEECDFSGVEAIEGDKALSCVADNGTLRIENKNENSVVRVYNIQGAMVAETSDDVVNNLPEGLYIVTVENKSFKVSLR